MAYSIGPVALGYGLQRWPHGVQDDPSRHDYNVDKYVDQFVQDALKQANHTQTDHQMWACGSDFQYQNADHWYQARMQARV